MMTGSHITQTVELVLPTKEGYEKVARNAAAAVAEQMGFSPDRIEDLKTAVAEACLNAIEHGNQLNRSATVGVVMRAEETDGFLEINVADQGLSAMPKEFLKPTPAGSADFSTRGWGMFFIQQLVDEVEISTLPSGGNQVRMVIRLTPDTVA